ncbi:MAG: YecA family protein [Kofleriaceae bacterium]
MPLTPSEQLVYDLCKKSFLSLWSYANPRKSNDKHGKELCDALAVFGRHVIVFSVKDVTLKPHADPKVAADRWIRRAIDESVDQLHGARRTLSRMRAVTKDDGTLGIDLPPPEERIVHLVAVAAGGNREIPFAGGQKGDDDAYVHVLDEFALREILKELDTAPDFVHYLQTKESFPGVVICEGEENLFAMYLHRGRVFPDVDMVNAEDGLWRQVQDKPEFKARKIEDEISYWWDQRIEGVIEDFLIAPEASRSLNENERVVRAMASETRFQRRMLSNAFIGWLEKRRTGARVTYSPATDTAYVFLTCRNENRDTRVAELAARCFHVRSPRGPLWRQGTKVTKVVGLATEVHSVGARWSMDVMYMHKPEWSDEDERAADKGREIFAIPLMNDITPFSADEFPTIASKSKSSEARPGRNDPCTCGSGKKWKKCHGA